MQADQSVAAANEVLRSIGASHPELRTEVLGPELTVAVIVPTYADSAFLGDALRSVQRQSYEQWRCYVVDDASPENVDEVMSEFVDDPRFVTIRHGANAGLAAARNTGIRIATEHVVQFLDADDMLTPWSIATRVEDLRRFWYDPLVAGVHGQILQCTEETALDDLDSWTARPSLTTRDWLSSEGESPFTVHAPLVRLDVVKSLGGFDESFVNGAEDWDFWHRMLRHGYLFKPSRTVVGAYRQRRASMIREHGAVHLNRADVLFDAASQWVDVDPAAAASNARMPLSDARLANQRMIRAARWAGIRLAQTGSIDEAVNDEILGFLTPETTVQTRWDECHQAVRGGLVRGLGLSIHVISRLDRDAMQVIDAASDAIARRFERYCDVAATTPGTVSLARTRHDDVLIAADTLSDVAVLDQLRKALENAGVSVAAVDLDYVAGAAGASEAWRDAGVDLIPYNDVALGRCTYEVIVARRPAHPATLDLLATAALESRHAVFLDEPPSRMLLDESPGSDFELPVADADRIVSLTRGGEAPVVGSTPKRGTDFSLLLPAEEDPLDAADHEWFMDMRDHHRGETAIVIGNGPSLNQIDFSLLTGRHTIGVNSIFLAGEKLTEPLTYYVVEDTAVFKDNEQRIKDYQAGTKLFPTLYRPRFEPDEITPSTHFFRMNQGFYGRTSRFGPTRTVCHPRFSTDAAQRVYCGQSVTIINLQLAHWFGYHRILMIGMDFTYQIPDDADRRGNIIVSRSDDPNHFHPDYFGAGKTWKDPKLDRVLVNYHLAKAMFEASGREIVNCTIGGALDVFPRATLEQALSNGE
jgi:hypothetical protein